MFINNNKYELSNVFLNMFDNKLVKINDKHVINDMMYSDEMNIMIPFNTYIMLYAIDNKINVNGKNVKIAPTIALNRSSCFLINSFIFLFIITL